MGPYQKAPQKGITKLQYFFLRLFCLVFVSIDYKISNLIARHFVKRLRGTVLNEL